MEYECTETDLDGEDKALVLKVKLGSQIEFISQVFFEFSVYDLVPAAESFWEEVFDLAVKLYAPETLESLKIYQDDQEKVEIEQPKMVENIKEANKSA